MGTRSIIAEPDGHQGWRGRYCHWDGYPQGVGVNLLAIVQRDGIEQARRILLHDFYGWSGINRAQPNIEGVEPDRDAEWGSPAYVAHQFGPDGTSGGGRWVNVPGYGEAYNPLPGVPENDTVFREFQRDEWLIEDHLAATWCEWLYIMEDDHLKVACIVPDPRPLRWFGSFDYDDVNEAIRLAKV